MNLVTTTKSGNRTPFHVSLGSLTWAGRLLVITAFTSIGATQGAGSVCIGSVRDCERSSVLSLYLVEPVATFLHNGFGI